MQRDALEWNIFEREWDRFMDFATDDDNPHRGWDTWSKSETGNHHKVKSAVIVLLERLAHAGWGEAPSMAWMCDLDNFDAVYRDHSKHLKEGRSNNESTRAQSLRNLKRPLEWAVTQAWLDENWTDHIEDWWSLSEQDRTQVTTLLGNLCKHVSTKGRKEYKCRREAGLDVPQLEQAELHDRVEALKKGVLERRPDTVAQKLEVCEATIAAMVDRGPRGIELYKLCFVTSEAEAAYIAKEELYSQGGACLIRHDHGTFRSYEVYAPSVKKHVNRCATNHDALIDLFLECVPPLKVGELMFTPTMHGLRECRANNKYQFDSATWSDYIQGMTKRRLGVALRPNAFRQIRSTHVTRFASPEVLASTAASMATSTRRLRDTYAQHPVHARTWLSTQVAKFEFDPRFGGRASTITVPVAREVSAVHSATSAFLPARLVRLEGVCAVYALFDVPMSGIAMLTGKTYRLDREMRDLVDRTASRMVLDPTSASQLWRNGGFATAQAEAIFAEAGVNTRDWVGGAVVTGDVGIHVGDIVYSHEHAAIAEVKATHGVTLQLSIAMETTICGDTHAKQAHYRFEHDTQLATVGLETIVFPIDLSFDGAAGVFIHRLSANLQTI